MTTILKPSECTSLKDIRTQVDRLDLQIADLLTDRIQYIVKAADFKPTVEHVRLQDRVEEIISTVTKIAASKNVDPDYIEMIYRILIDESIRREKHQWLRNNMPQS